MSRIARIYSPSGFMHVIARGIGKQLLFEDDQDYNFYISLLRKYSNELSISVCAYCLMDNHVHVLLYDAEKNVSKMMQKIGVCYAHYYNMKYDRTGHLFQDRFISEAIDSERYLLYAFRYIINNPKKAGICPADRYQWSSYNYYADKHSFVDTSWFEDVIGGWSEYVDFMGNDDEESYDFLDSDNRHDDTWALGKIKRVLHISNVVQIQTYGRKERDDAVRALKQAGLSVRQISRLTGINRGVVQKA